MSSRPSGKLPNPLFYPKIIPVILLGTEIFCKDLSTRHGDSVSRHRENLSRYKFPDPYQIVHVLLTLWPLRDMKMERDRSVPGMRIALKERSRFRALLHMPYSAT